MSVDSIHLRQVPLEAGDVVFVVIGSETRANRWYASQRHNCFTDLVEIQ
jgi:hypothetical protein